VANSNGVRSRRALVHEPKLIVCDEPDQHLDHGGGRKSMMNSCRRAKTPDRAIIVVTHDPRIFEFADRIATWMTEKSSKSFMIKSKERLQ